MMAYKNKFTACIKVDGKVLREQNEEVAIPFGSEYSITLKNLNNVRAQVQVSVDGTDATEGTWLVINPNSSVDLERFIRNGDKNQGNKFKFIERTSAIEQHRGIKEDDGLIRVQYKFAKVYTDYNYIVYNTPWSNRLGGTFYKASMDQTKCNYEETSMPRIKSSNYDVLRSCNMATTVTNTAMNVNTAGITVAGSKSNQKFVDVADFECELSNVLILKLVGQFGEKVVEKAITVNHKPECTTCGRKNKATNKFCSQCGTSLILF